MVFKHKGTNKLFVDFRDSFSTGIHISALYKLRNYYWFYKDRSYFKFKYLI